MENFYNKLSATYKDNGFNPQYGKKHMFRIPSRILLVGSSGSGKSNCLLNFLRKTSGTFDHIYLICKSLDGDPLYQMLKDKLKDSLTIYEDSVPDVDSIDVNGEQLMIFDDMVGDKEANNIINEYFKRGRKKHITCIYLSQSYYKTEKFIRSNCDFLIIKKVNSKKDLKLILSEYPLNCDIKTLEKIYNDCTKKFEDVMVIDILNSTIYYNFMKKIL